MPVAPVKNKRPPQETPSIQSLDRGLQILETVGKSPTPVSLSALTAVLKQLFGGKAFEPYTKHTILTLPELAKACREIKSKGYATDNSEFMEGVRCVAAPIRGKDGTVIASIGISAPTTRFPPERLE